jgi:hypothetical protein
MGRRILDLLNDRAMSVSWNLPISVKLPESLREIIIWASGNLAWGETPVPETALLSALSNIGVVEFRMHVTSFGERGGAAQLGRRSVFLFAVFRR